MGNETSSEVGIREGEGPVGSSARDAAAGALAREKLAIELSPLRWAIVSRLQLTPATAFELAAELNAPADAVRHQLRKLARAGLIYRGPKTQRRGVAEHLFSADPRDYLIESEEIAGVPSKLVSESDLSRLRLLFREAKGALDAGTFTKRKEFVLIRMPLPLDDRIWLEAAEVHGRLLEDILEIAVRARTRARGADDAIFATAGLLYFPIPEGSWQRPAPAGDGAGTRRLSHRNPLDRVESITDPLRMRIVDELTVRPASAAELALELALPTDAIRYHLRRLHASHMIQVHSERTRRGLTEKRFIADCRKQIFRAVDVRPGPRLERFTKVATMVMFREALRATEDGTYWERPDSCSARVPMYLDAQGFGEISQLFEAALDRLFELRDECLSRLEPDRRDRRTAISGLLFFERAPH